MNNTHKSKNHNYFIFVNQESRHSSECYNVIGRPTMYNNDTIYSFIEQIQSIHLFRFACAKQSPTIFIPGRLKTKRQLILIRRDNVSDKERCLKKGIEKYTTDCQYF